MNSRELDHARLVDELGFPRPEKPKHTCPAGKTSIMVEPRIYYTNQGRYRPKRKGKFLGSFYTLEGAKEALVNADLRNEYKALKSESERLRRELNELEVKITNYERMCGGILDEIE